MAGSYLVETLGCKSNRYDSQRLAEALEALGYRRAAQGQTPDVCLINTCTVTSVADAKSRKTAARLAREYPASRVYITGCYATARPDELRAIPGIAGIYARKDWAAMLEHIRGAALPAQCSTPDGDFGIRSFGGRTRAFLKIQEGCDAFCSYCVLPYVRGRPRSQPLAGVRAEARRLVAAGFHEIVLTGIHLGYYGRDLDGRVGLADAILAVAETPGLARLRVSSLEANEVNDALVAAMRHPAVCAHLHLPLQSGDAGVLERMNRSYTPESFMAAVEFARDRLDRPAVTTDVICGFPGEGEQEFVNTLEFCRRARFGRIHVFPFSRREGTPAATMPDQVPPAVARERVGRLIEVAGELAAEWAEAFVGRQERVVFERRDESARLTGYTDRYVPITAFEPDECIGRAMRVLCRQRDGARLVGGIAGPWEARD